MRRATTVGLATSAALSLLAGCSAGPPSTTKTGAELVADASAKAEAKGSAVIHIVATSTSGQATQPVEELRSKVSAPAASQRLRFTTGSGNLDVRLVGSTAYVRADATTLFKGLALTKQTAPSYAGKWISLEQSDSPFASIAETMTLKSQLATFLPTGKKVVVGDEKTLQGHRVIPLTGPAAAGGTGGKGEVRLLIDAKSHLPVGAGVVKVTSGSTLKIVADFSRWGQPIHVPAPSEATPYSSLVGAGG